MSVRPIELLAPAKNKLTAFDAINCGADAVYIGATGFGARALAGNSIEDIEQVVKYAHLFNAKVYVTVNTIIKDDELEAVKELVNALYRIHVDALIVQDMALLRLDLPPIALHASTQCDIRTPQKARFLQDVGFSQLVLARELSRDEIAQIKEHTDVPLEAFIHGALCVSYSGRCAVSAAITGRSANRGECAQLCRIPYDLIDGRGTTHIRNKHLLSLRDFSQSDNLEDLLEAGISSLKIEGRLKDSGYVKNIVAYYRELLDDIIQKHSQKYRRASLGVSHTTFRANPYCSFNRGFTSYFFSQRHPHSSMASFDTPKSLGEPIGEVTAHKGRTLTIKTDKTLSNGDGLSFLNPTTGEWDGFRANVVRGSQVETMQALNIPVRATLFRTFDKAFSEQLERPCARTIGLNFALSRDGEHITLTATDQRDNTASIPLECSVQQADKPQTEAQRRTLSKVGNTIFRIEEISTLDGLFIPASILSEARRQLLDSLNEIQLQKTIPSDHILHEQADATIEIAENVANRLARAFYTEHRATSIIHAIEIKRHLTGEETLMHTRYCLRRELGACLRNNPLQARKYAEPLTLQATTFRLGITFDCKHCEMRLHRLK